MKMETSAYLCAEKSKSSGKYAQEGASKTTSTCNKAALSVMSQGLHL